MTFRKNNKRVDEAWSRLHDRLDQDGLLAEDISADASILHSRAFRWAAAIAVLFISATIALMVYNSDNRRHELLTLHNTGSEANLVTTLEDGSIVYLTQQTSLSYPEHFESSKREVFLQGDAFFDIHRNTEKPFFIETDQIKVEVLGTAFNVKSRNDQPFSLSVLRGEVKVTFKKSGQSSNIKAGQTVLLNDQELQRVPTENTGQFADYTNRIHFKDERLSDVIRVINLNSDGIHIELSPQLENRRLTVTFMNESTTSIAQLICMALNLQYKQTDENTIRIAELNQN